MVSPILFCDPIPVRLMRPEPEPNLRRLEYALHVLRVEDSAFDVRFR